MKRARRNRRAASHISSVEIRHALRLSGGAVEEAARRIGLRQGLFRYRLVKRPALREYAADLRRIGREERRIAVWKLLKKHRGNLARAAREFGVGRSGFADGVERLGLSGVLKALRPRRPSPAQEKAQILTAIRQHRGQLRSVYSELAISKGTLRSKMLKYSLVAEADTLRVAHNLIGPRTEAPLGNVAERREKLLALIEKCGWNLSQATERADVAPATFYKNLRELRIKRPARLTMQHRFHRLVDALRLFKGQINLVGRSLRVPNATVLAWCEEFEIDPRRYRRG